MEVQHHDRISSRRSSSHAIIVACHDMIRVPTHVTIREYIQVSSNAATTTSAAAVAAAAAAAAVAVAASYLCVLRPDKNLVVAQIKTSVLVAAAAARK